MGYERSWVLHNSAVSSNYSGPPILTVDCASLSVSFETTNTGASRWTLQMSNGDGFGAALREAGWSTLTTITLAPVAVTIDPGPRWVRVNASSIDSTSTVLLQGWVA